MTPLPDRWQRLHAIVLENMANALAGRGRGKRSDLPLVIKLSIETLTVAERSRDRRYATRLAALAKPGRIAATVRALRGAHDAATVERRLAEIADRDE
jgi:hypothetical protein